LHIANAVKNALEAPSDEGAGFLRSKKTGGEIFSSWFSPTVTACAVPPPSSEGGTLLGGILLSICDFITEISPCFGYTKKKETGKEFSYG